MNEQNKQPEQERRQYVRINANDVLYCKNFTGDDFISDTKGFDLMTMTKNLSGGGVLFESDVKFEVGDLLKLKINVPGWEKYKSEFLKEDDLSIKKPLIVLASVVRVESLPAGSYHVAVSFSAIDKGHQWAIIKCIDDLRKHEE